MLRICIEKSALHAFAVIKYIAAHEMASMFVVPHDSSSGCDARFDLVYEPGGYWAGPGGNARCAKHWRPPLLIVIRKPSLKSAPIAKSDVPDEVVVKAGNTPNRRRIHRKKSAITHEATRTSVINHNANQIQTTVGLLIEPVRKETRCRLRVDQFRPKELNFARENR